MDLRRTIRRCVVELKTCPRTWESLAPTNLADVRHCSTCARDVHFCSTDAETLDRARRGDCIARLEPDPEDVPNRTVVLGRPNVVELPSLTSEERAASELAARERGIREALARLDYDTAPCADCGYPVPTFRKSCYVCGETKEA